MSRFRSVLLVVLAGATVWSSELPVQAESGDLNLHLQPGFGAPIAGRLTPPGDDGFDRVIPAGWASLDWQFSRPWAAEFILGVGRQIERSDEIAASSQEYWMVGLGIRWRPLDDAEGYLTERQGNPWGNLWVAAYLSWQPLDLDVQTGITLAAGYEFSIHRPMQIGPFLQLTTAFAGRRDDVTLALFGGISVSFALLGDNAPYDTDADGIPDIREEELGTNPLDNDTDGDGILDGVELEGPTDPLASDTDGDGLRDGVEDENRNGRRDAGETDPADPDTDDGGVTDGDEQIAGTNPLQRQDDLRDEDRDGVPDETDQCPDTPRGREVGQNGCQIIGETVRLEGILFRSGRADILPESERSLMLALRLLRSDPDTRVEIAGHTDDQGSVRYNQQLSQRRAEAVRNWLIERGINPGRLSARGYGESDPVATNDTEEGRARNRRIEFRRR